MPIVETRQTEGCILLFVKSPEHGPVKSRLAQVVGVKIACELYRNFVSDILETLADVTAGERYDLRVCFYPAGAGEGIRTWLGARFTCMPQEGRDLGERMNHAFQSGFAAGYRRMLILGSDTPDLTPDIIREGFQHLDRHAAVIGPAHDGGYYLLGFRSKTFIPAIFEGIPWSTERVFEETMAAFRRAGAEVAVLPPWRDVDTLADLQALQKRCENKLFQHSHTMRYLASVNRNVGVRRDLAP